MIKWTPQGPSGWKKNVFMFVPSVNEIHDGTLFLCFLKNAVVTALSLSLSLSLSLPHLHTHTHTHKLANNYK